MKRDVISDFHSNLPLKKLSKKYGMDERKIKKIWVNFFGSSATDDRISRIRYESIKSKRSLCKNVVKEIYNLFDGGHNTREISNKLKISLSVVHKYLKKDEQRHKRLIDLNKEKLSLALKKIRKRDSISKLQEQEIISYFDSDLFQSEIASLFNLSNSSISNIFKKYFTEEKRKERKKRLEPNRIKKSFVGLESAGKNGSRAERAFFKLLGNKLGHKVVHHDFNLCPPYEIDISIPELKVAICWDGITHREPIYGQKHLNMVQSRDLYKMKIIKEKKWLHFNIEDNCNHFDANFIEKSYALFLNFLHTHNIEVLFNE